MRSCLAIISFLVPYWPKLHLFLYSRVHLITSNHSGRVWPSVIVCAQRTSHQRAHFVLLLQPGQSFHGTLSFASGAISKSATVGVHSRKPLTCVTNQIIHCECGNRSCRNETYSGTQGNRGGDPFFEPSASRLSRTFKYGKSRTTHTDPKRPLLSAPVGKARPLSQGSHSS